MITKTKPLGMVHILVSLSASFMVAIVILLGMAATAHAAVPVDTTEVATVSEARPLAANVPVTAAPEAVQADADGADVTNLVALCAAVAGVGFIGAGVTIALAMSRLSI